MRSDQVGSMDFMHDQLAIEAGFFLSSMRIIRTLNQLLEWRKKTYCATL